MVYYDASPSTAKLAEGGNKFALEVYINALTVIWDCYFNKDIINGMVKFMWYYHQLFGESVRCLFRNDGRSL